MFDGIGRFFVEFFIKWANKLPNVEIDVNQQINDISHYMAKVNYFVPFGTFATIFNWWMVAVFSSAGVILFMKFFNKFWEV